MDATITSDGEYAVVRQAPQNMIFSVLHDRRCDAIEEAKRLASREQHKFLVLKVIGYAEQKPNPAVWVDLEDGK